MNWIFFFLMACWCYSWLSQAATLSKNSLASWTRFSFSLNSQCLTLPGQKRFCLRLEPTFVFQLLPIYLRVATVAIQASMNLSKLASCYTQVCLTPRLWSWSPDCFECWKIPGSLLVILVSGPRTRLSHKRFAQMPSSQWSVCFQILRNRRTQFAW